MSTLERAIAIAAKAHEGQVDKAGAPYILHPLRVMQCLVTVEGRIAAVLHDVVEDCGVPLDGLRKEGFSDIVIEAIDSVTKRPGEEYDAFISRAAMHPVGRRVKLADLEDNIDLSRIVNPTDSDIERTRKYVRAIQVIKELSVEEMMLEPLTRLKILVCDVPGCGSHAQATGHLLYTKDKPGMNVQLEIGCPDCGNTRWTWTQSIQALGNSLRTLPEPERKILCNQWVSRVLTRRGPNFEE